MGGHPPCLDHVILGVTSHHVGEMRSYINRELSEGSSHQDLSCPEVLLKRGEEEVKSCCFAVAVKK